MSDQTIDVEFVGIATESDSTLNVEAPFASKDFDAAPNKLNVSKKLNPTNNTSLNSTKVSNEQQPHVIDLATSDEEDCEVTIPKISANETQKESRKRQRSALQTKVELVSCLTFGSYPVMDTWIKTEDLEIEHSSEDGDPRNSCSNLSSSSSWSNPWDMRTEEQRKHSNSSRGFGVVDHAKLKDSLFEDPEFPAKECSISGSLRDTSLPPPTPPQCKCQHPCVQKIVFKQTRNAGRRFWCCKSKACNFFKWAPREEWVTSNSNLVWRRPPQWPAYPSVVATNGFRADDVRQGKLGDCWFLSALSVLAERPDLVEKLFVNVSPRPEGGPYHVRLFIDGDWRVITLDDNFPCLKNLVAKSRQVKPNQNERFSLAFCKATRNQLWVPLLEKAYAKAHGCYTAISGGWIAEALFDLTGRPTETIGIGNIGADELYNLLQSFHSNGYPLGASCHAPDKYSGLLGHHAYSILDIRTTELRAEKQPKLKEMIQRKARSESNNSPSEGRKLLRLIKLRNPHGQGEWRGPFSRKSPEWSPSLRAELGQTDENNGTFWMPFDLFLANFCHGTIDICKAPRPNSGWQNFSWKTRFEPFQWWNEEILEMRTESASWVHFSVCQATKRGKVDGTYTYCDVAVLVVQLSDDGSISKVLRLSLPGQCKTHHFELFLEPGHNFGVLSLSLGRCAEKMAGSAAKFTLRLMTSKQLELRKRYVPSPAIYVDCIHRAMLDQISNPSTELEGFKLLPSQGLLRDEFHLVAVESPSAILVVAVNPSFALHATVQIIVSGLDDRVATNVAKDLSVPTHYIPPSSSRIIAAFSINGFQDYEYGFGPRTSSTSESSSSTSNFSSFNVSMGTVIHLDSKPADVINVSNQKSIFDSRRLIPSE